MTYLPALEKQMVTVLQDTTKTGQY